MMVDEDISVKIASVLSALYFTAFSPFLSLYANVLAVYV
jgi:hypothetical protein